MRQTLDTLTLDKGSHESPAHGMCIMEAVAYFAGEQHSDAPRCVCPIVSGFLRIVNDFISSAERQALKPLIPMIIGSRAARDVAVQRMYRFTDWAVREVAPLALDCVDLQYLAVHLRNLHPIVVGDTNFVVVTDTTRSVATAASQADSAAYASVRAASAAVGAAFYARAVNTETEDVSRAAIYAGHTAAAASKLHTIDIVPMVIDLISEMVGESALPDDHPIWAQIDEILVREVAIS